MFKGRTLQNVPMLSVPDFLMGWSARGLQLSRSGKAFVFEVVTAGADTFQLPIYDGGTYNFNVSWGDGGSDYIAAYDNAAANHSYAGAGTYTVRITGTINGWRFNSAGDKTLIHDISSWGPLLTGNLGGYFFGCSNLTVSATDVLDTAAVTTFYNAFRGCSSLTTLDVSLWDIAAVTTFRAAFYSCSSLTTLDVSLWDIAAVTTFRTAFYGCSSLTTLDVSLWDTAAVTTFYNAFYNCSSLTTLAANNWDITAVIVMTAMFHGVTLTTANYSDILIGWEAQLVQNNVDFHGGNSTYSAGAAATARQALVADHTWTITDGGAA